MGKLRGSVSSSPGMHVGEEDGDSTAAAMPSTAALEGDAAGINEDEEECLSAGEAAAAAASVVAAADPLPGSASSAKSSSAYIAIGDGVSWMASAREWIAPHIS